MDAFSCFFDIVAVLNKIPSVSEFYWETGARLQDGARVCPGDSAGQISPWHNWLHSGETTASCCGLLRVDVSSRESVLVKNVAHIGDRHMCLSF